MPSKDFLAGLNGPQREAAETIFGPVLVLAGAGTGKTRVITCRIAHMIASGIAPQSILGLTFTNKAAREMRERLESMIDPEAARKVTLGTFHAFCVKLLRRDITRIGYLSGFTIADESDQQGLLKQAAASLGYSKEDVSLPAFAAGISNWKNRLIDPDGADQVAANPYEEQQAIIYRAYQKLLKLQNMIDFDDMLLLVFKLFSEVPELLEKYRERYQFLLVDEYQDTNDAQFTLIRLLAGSARNLCVVGDDDQSIYSWRGANVNNILDFPQLFPGTKVVRLEQNYRSRSKILELANAIISGNAKRHQKRLWSELGEGENTALIEAEDDEKEADFIAHMIKQRAEEEKRHFADFAILYRSNHLSRQLEMALRRASVPYRLVGGQEFYKRKEIKDAVAYLKLIVNPFEDQSLLRVLATPPRGLAEKAVEALKSCRASRPEGMVHLLGESIFLEKMSTKAASSAKELSDSVKRAREHFQAPGDLARKVSNYLRDAGYLDGLQKIYRDYDDALKRRENIDEFINAIAQYEKKSDHPVMLEEYLESFALLEENDRTKDDEDGDAVTLSTVHASKGLEYPVVFVIAMERNIFPHERAIEEGSIDEETRLFYVAVTRAREALYLTRASVRMQRGITRETLPSPFLALLPQSAIYGSTPDELLKPVDADEFKNAVAALFAKLK